MTRAINPAGLAIIKANESCRLKGYLDPVGIPTIGWGHTPAKLGQSITQAQADELLAVDVGIAAATVDSVTHDVSTTDNQFSAMCSLAYNIGAGAFKRSSVLFRHRAMQYDAAGDAFLMWDKAHIDGSLVILTGLLNRRQQERELYRT